MIERMTTSGTIMLLDEMKKLAVSDKKRYDRQMSRNGKIYVNKNMYDSAVYFLDEQLPVIREILGQSFKG